ncbi:general secretion pathway protein GspB [Dongshaea marina]|uniref:general secretion pathway protein GspB n=1 Tax=Dongshaea marina TaxID=2047966 RepID=UPI000D3E45F7|nr:general secretion pathway protein GspB [Dongshaea marina]
MSTILSALQQSEQQRQQVKPQAIAMQLAGHHQGAKKHPYLYLLLAPVCLAVGVGGAYLWSHQFAPKPVKAEVAAITPLKLQTFNTQPLPIITPPPRVIAATSEVKAKSQPQSRPKQAQDEFDLKGISPSLASNFLKAVKATGQQGNTPSQAPAQPAVAAQNNQDSVFSMALPLGSLPMDLQKDVPALQYSSHVYSSSAGDRVVTLNGKDYHQGSWVTPKLQLLEIGREGVIMRVDGQSFSLKALTDWPGVTG